jgi:hypothetical protein
MERKLDRFAWEHQEVLARGACAPGFLFRLAPAAQDDISFPPRLANLGRMAPSLRSRAGMRPYGFDVGKAGGADACGVRADTMRLGQS